MKHTLILVLILFIALFSCSDPAEDRFYGMEQPSLSVSEWIENQSSFQEFTQLLAETGLDSLLKRNTAFTVFVIADDNLPDLSGFSVEDKRTILSNHLSNFVLYSASLDQGSTLKMLSGKNIFFDKMGQTILANDEVSLLHFDNMATNGVIHEVSGIIDIKDNLLEYIQNDTRFSYLAAFFNQGTTLLFDSLNSIPIGIDEEGQTLYDTIWKQSNPFFNEMADLGEEDAQFTMFLAPDELLDTASAGNYKFGYLANPGSFILNGIYETSDLPGSFTAVDGFNLLIEEGNYQLLEKLSNGFAYGLNGFGGIRIPKKFSWELTDVTDFDSIRNIKATQYADVYESFKEIWVTELNGDFTSFKYEIFSGPLNKDYLQIITTSGTSAKVNFKLPPILPGKYLIKLNAQVRRVDGMLFDVLVNSQTIGTGISLNGGEYQWDLTELGTVYISEEFGNVFTLEISGSNNNYVRGYFDYLEFEPVN